MTKKILLILTLLSLTSQLFCQKISFKNDSENSNLFFIGIGGHYTAFLKSGRYIVPSSDRTINMKSSLLGYKRLDSYSYDIVFSYQKIYKDFVFATGLNFSNRTNIYQSDSSSIKNNAIFFPDNFPYKDIIKFHVAYHNIECPISFGYKYRKNQLLAFLVFSLNLNNRFVMTDKFNDTRTETTHLFEWHILCDFIPSDRFMYFPGIVYTRDLNNKLQLYLGASYLGYNYGNIMTGLSYKFLK